MSHLQFEAIIVAARTSTSLFDFALVALLGLLGLRVFEACNSTIDDLGEEHGHRILRVLGKGTKLALIPATPAVGRAIDRAVTATATGWTAMPPPAGYVASPQRPACDCHGDESTRAAG